METISATLVNMWMADLETLSKPWVIWTFVPLIYYGVLMCLKWVFVFTPVWLPVAVVLSLVARDSTSKTEPAPAQEPEKPKAPYKLEPVDSKPRTIQ